MTVAVDIKTGKVVGQVTRDDEHIDPTRGIHSHRIQLLTRDGYRTVDAASVRLEETGN